MKDKKVKYVYFEDSWNDDDYGDEFVDGIDDEVANQPKGETIED